MWMDYIGEIGMAVFILLILLHFAQHWYYRAIRIKHEKQKQQAEVDSTSGNTPS